MEGIEEKALDTLKMAINQLLLTFDDKKGTKTYEKTDGLSKREQIEELMKLLTEEQESIERTKKPMKEKNASLTST